MVVDLGGGTTEIAVISLSGIVSWRSLKLAGDKLDEAIIQYARDKFNLLLGQRTAERIKIQVGSVLPLNQTLEAVMRGRDLITGLPKEVHITDSNVREAIIKPIKIIVDSIKATIESSPPELVSDLYEKGMVLTGGGALIRGLDELISKETKMPVYITDEPLTAVVRGAGKILDDLEHLKEVLLPPTKDLG
jgi:rod shape-determining protein MreB